MKTYIVKPGDTLSKIGSSQGIPWKDIFKANPNIKNPNLIYPGQKIIIPGPEEKTLSGETLEKTLPPAEPLEGEVLPLGKSPLPTEKLDQLTLLRLALRDVSQSAYSKGMVSKRETAFEKFEPEKMGGGTFADIMSFTEQQARAPIERKFKTMETILKDISEQQERQRERSRQNLEVLINSEALSLLEDKDLNSLATTAGIPIEQLKALKTAQQTDAAVVDAYRRGIEQGMIDISSIPSSMRDDVVKGIDWEVPGVTEGGESRVNRHFNPIAVTDAKKEWQDILTKNNIPFEIGDQLPGDPSLHTIRFPDMATGIEASRVLLGNSDAFYWYKNHTGKEILDSLNINTPEQFKNLPTKTQNKIIDEIYINEGGVVKSKQLAKDYFSKTQLAKGASAAKMELDEFGELSVDEANKYIYGEIEEEVAKPEDQIHNLALYYKEKLFSEKEAKSSMEVDIKEALGLSKDSKLPKEYTKLIEDALWLVYHPEDQAKGDWLWGLFPGTPREEIEAKFESEIEKLRKKYNY